MAFMSPLAVLSVRLISKCKHAYTLNYDGDHGSIAPAKH